MMMMEIYNVGKFRVFRAIFREAVKVEKMYMTIYFNKKKIISQMLAH